MINLRTKKKLLKYTSVIQAILALSIRELYIMSLFLVFLLTKRVVSETQESEFLKQEQDLNYDAPGDSQIG